LNQEVEWAFTATRGSRKLKITDISYNSLPLGVLKHQDGKSFVLKGKVQTADARSGLIAVTAYDEKACQDVFEQMKKMVADQVKSAGNTNVSIPVSPCELKRMSDYSAASSYMMQGYFTWRLQDGTDDLKPENYPAFVSGNLFKTPQSLTDAIRGIPLDEAPHTVDVFLGTCASRPRKLCGEDPSCLWGVNSCSSKEATGRVAQPDSSTTGAESDIVIVPSGGVKR
jgi:hypothetical protein